MSTYFNINYELSPQRALERIDERIAENRPGFICVSDGNILTMVHKDMAYRETVNSSMFSICDSSWVPLYLNRLYGIKPPQYCGSDIFKDITQMKKYRMLFMGASQTVLDALKEQMTKVDERIAQMKFVELPFRKVDEFDYEAIAAEVNADAPDIIWLALGAPKQEIFASRLTPLLNRGVVIPVGAVFNFRSGLNIKRAPSWMVKCHLEFVHRMFVEPKKQIRRVWTIVSALPAIYKEERCRKL